MSQSMSLASSRSGFRFQLWYLLCDHWPSSITFRWPSQLKMGWPYLPLAASVFGCKNYTEKLKQKRNLLGGYYRAQRINNRTRWENELREVSSSKPWAMLCHSCLTRLSLHELLPPLLLDHTLPDSAATGHWMLPPSALCIAIMRWIVKDSNSPLGACHWPNQGHVPIP